jgi:hypothetical protein
VRAHWWSSLLPYHALSALGHPLRAGVDRVLAHLV